MSPKIVDKQKRKREILTAAFALFVEKGYYKTTLGDIARSAGMGQGTLYYYFPSKDLIFWAVYEQFMSDFESRVNQQVSVFQSPKEQLQRLLRLLFQNFPEADLFDDFAAEDEPMQSEFKHAVVGFSRVFMEFWLQAERSPDKREEFYQRITQQQKGLITMLQQLLEAVGLSGRFGLDGRAMAHLLVAMRDGLSFQLRMGAIEEPASLLESIGQALFRELQDSEDTQMGR